jgi:pimeloyl-ACP methyl ester carboxylesterase
MDGQTGDPPARSMDDYAGDVIDLLDALHIQDAVIGGLSMGGYVAFALYRHAPQYFRGMILADTRAEADTPEGVEGRKRMLALVARSGAAGVADEMLPKLLGETTRREHPEVVERVRRLVLSNSPEAIAGAVTALMTRADSRPLLGSIHFPVLIVSGSEDTITPPKLAEDMHAALPGSSLVVIQGAGHLSSLERPAEFNAALTPFLDHRV